jgi:glycosyltransferase involved in cell wall biosynthesis
MSACIEAALRSEALRRELSERGRERAQRFAWRRCAEQTLEILAGVAREGRKHV